MQLNNFFLLNVFTGPNAKGNQCCVLMLDDLSDDQKLQNIASDFNLPATAFIKQENENVFSIRWFAPFTEIGLCGHGTIAAIWAVSRMFPDLKNPRFKYKDGELIGTMKNDLVLMTGSAIPSAEKEIPEHVKRGFHGKAIGYFPSSNKDIVLFEKESDIIEMLPDWDVLRTSQTFGYIITAKSAKHDFVSRVLLPHTNFLEDQATGSSHLVLTPFWSMRLGKTELRAFQASERGGEVKCVLDGDDVRLEALCTLIGRGNIV